MSTFRNPVGPQSPKVYWRRRLVVLLGLLAVIVVIVLIVVQPRDGAPTTPTTGPSGSSTPGSTSTAGPGDTVECDPSKVTLEAITDASSYDPGVNPQLSFTLKSTMSEPCLLDAGSDLQVFTITSGDEVIWLSTDCQTDEQAAQILLQPGVPRDSGFAIPWDRTRSSPDTCDAEREQVVAGGASYHLSVAIGDVESAATKQFLLF